MVTIRDDAGSLSFTVADDGGGFDPDCANDGHGLTNLADRVDALGGHLELKSAPGRGTTIEGRIPIPELVQA
jgi:signal transduction histidine kinase